MNLTPEQIAQTERLIRYEVVKTAMINSISDILYHSQIEHGKLKQRFNYLRDSINTNLSVFSIKQNKLTNDLNDEKELDYFSSVAYKISDGITTDLSDLRVCTLLLKRYVLETGIKSYAVDELQHIRRIESNIIQLFKLTGTNETELQERLDRNVENVNSINIIVK